MKEVSLPQPTKSAKDISSLSVALVSDALSLWGVPGAAVVSRGFEIYQTRRIEAAQKILFEAIGRGEVELFNSPDYENLIPNTFAYLESARQGEYIHNLKILANLLLGECRLDISDPGKLRRAGRRIEAMSLVELEMLSFLKKAFEIKKNSADFDGYHACIEARDIVNLLGREYISPEEDINSQLTDLVSRGFLFFGSSPGLIGGQFFYKTTAFDEIIEAAMAAREQAD